MMTRRTAPNATDAIFSRRSLTALRVTFARKNLTRYRIMKDAWVWNGGRDYWEFHGPFGFLASFRADNAYDARYKGWSAFLDRYHPDQQ